MADESQPVSIPIEIPQPDLSGIDATIKAQDRLGASTANLQKILATIKNEETVKAIGELKTSLEEEYRAWLQVSQSTEKTAAEKAAIRDIMRELGANIDLLAGTLESEAVAQVKAATSGQKLNAVLAAQTIEARKAQQAEEELAATEAKLANAQIAAYTQLSKQTQAMIASGGAGEKAAINFRTLHASLSPLTSDIPGLTHLVTLWHYGLTAATAGLFIGAEALNHYIKANESVIATLGKMPTYSEGLTKAIKQMRLEQQLAVVDGQLFEEQLLRIAKAQDTVAERSKRVQELRAERETAESALDDRRKGLEIAMAEAKFADDAIGRAVALLQIEEKYAEIKRQAADSAAKEDLAERARRITNLEIERDNLKAPRKGLEGAAAESKGRLDLDKAAITNAEKTIADAKKGIEELQAERDKLTTLGKLWTLSDVQNDKELFNAQENMRATIKAAEDTIDKINKGLPQRELQAGRDKAALDTNKGKSTDVEGQLARENADYKAAQSKYGIEANQRLGEERLQQITDHYKVINDLTKERLKIEKEIAEVKPGEDVKLQQLLTRAAQLQEKIDKLKAETAQLEKAPLPTEQLFPSRSGVQNFSATRKAYLEKLAKEEKDARDKAFDLEQGGQDAWLNQHGRRNIYTDPESQKKAFDEAVRDANSSADRKSAAYSDAYGKANQPGLPDYPSGPAPIGQPPKFSSTDKNPVLPPTLPPPPSFQPLADSIAKFTESTNDSLKSIQSTVTKAISDLKTSQQAFEQRVQNNLNK